MWKKVMWLLLGVGIWGMGTAVAQDQDEKIFMPVVVGPVYTFEPADGLQNPSFEEPWTDLPPVSGNLINQEPESWDLRWIEPGQPLFDSSDVSGGIPECIHKLAEQLPPEEQPGGERPLILAGETVYKVFHFGAPFGVELTQTVTGLTPGARMRLIVPVQVHMHEDTDPWGAESGVWVDGVGGWVNGGVMGDRQWYEHRRVFTVPASGEVTIAIRFKSKWPRAKDFFIDHLRLEASS